jgi:hypothetical protein
MAKRGVNKGYREDAGQIKLADREISKPVGKLSKPGGEICEPGGDICELLGRYMWIMRAIYVNYGIKKRLEVPSREICKGLRERRRLVGKIREIFDVSRGLGKASLKRESVRATEREERERERERVGNR